MKYYFSMDAPHLWIFTDNKGKVLDRGSEEILADLNIPNKAEVTAVVPGTEVVCHRVSVPSRNRQKVLAALPFALEEMVSTDIEELHVAMLDWLPDQETVAAVVARARLDQWLDAAAGAGISVDRMVPEYALLPIHQQARMTMAKNRHGGVSIRQDRHFGMTLEEDMLVYWWQELHDNALAIAVNDKDIARKLIELDGARVSEWDIGEDFGQWIHHGGDQPPVPNLLQGSYLPESKKTQGGNLKAGLIILLISVAAYSALNAGEWYLLNRDYRQLNQNVETLFKQAFPDTRRNFNFEHFMSKVERLRSGEAGKGDFLYLLAAVARAVPRARATVEELNFRDNQLTVTCSTANFAGLEQLRKQFESDTGIVVEQKSSGSRDNKVSGRFLLSRQS